MLKYFGFVLALLILITSVLGVKTRNSRYIKQYILDDYEYGIYLSNDNEIFYNITPFDFAYNSIKEPRNLVEWFQFVENNQNPFLTKIYEIIPTLFSSLNMYNPHKMVQTEVGEFYIRTRINDNKLTVSTTIPLERKNIIKTISFNRDDVVFDAHLEIYNKANMEALGYFSEYTKYKFKNDTENTEISSSNRIFIFNLQNPGIIEVKIPGGGGVVDANSQLIRINTGNNEDMELVLYNKLEDITL